MSKILNLYLISDSSGETVIAVSKAVMVQFTAIEVVENAFWLVRTKQQVDSIVDAFNRKPGIAIYTMGKGEIRNYFIEMCQKHSIPHICPLQSIVNFVSRNVDARPSDTGPGKYKRLGNDYYERMNHINYALTHDDGQLCNDWQSADIILLGISRTSKSPTSLYLAQRGYNVINIPIVADLSLNIDNIDEMIAKRYPMIIGLTISPNHLLRVRNARLQSLTRNLQILNESIIQYYSSMDSIRHEIQYAKALFKSLNANTIDVTNKAVEEVAAEIINIHSERIKDMN